MRVERERTVEPRPRGLAAAEAALDHAAVEELGRVERAQAERALRAEMLRDSLTGLPNRLAFAEKIEQAGEDALRDVQHAVLVVDMLRFSRINESMGSLAGALVAGLLIGEVVSLTTLWAPALAEITPFAVMALVLLLRPSGIFGEAGLME